MYTSVKDTICIIHKPNIKKTGLGRRRRCFVQKVETRFLIKARIKRTVTLKMLSKMKIRMRMVKNAIIFVVIVMVITAKLGTYVTLWDSSVTIVAVGENVFTGGEEETDKPEVSSLPSSSP